MILRLLSNITYKNIGYAEGYQAGINKSGNITYAVHHHTDSCYVLCGGTVICTYIGKNKSGTPEYKHVCNKCGHTTYCCCNGCGGGICNEKKLVCGYSEGQIISATINY